MVYSSRVPMLIPTLIVIDKALHVVAGLVPAIHVFT
jgi:hypothetical protein